MMSSVYVFSMTILAASGYSTSPICAVFLRATVTMVAEGLSPNETRWITQVSGSLHDVHVLPEKTMRVLFDRHSFNRVVHLLYVSHECNFTFSQSYKDA